MGGAVRDALARGDEALASGDFDTARDAFEEASADGDPEALDGLARTLWWIGDVDGAIASRERAYLAFRNDGQTGRAARIALWLGREYAEAIGNEPAANGWIARAEGLLRDSVGTSDHGWLELTRADRALDPAEMRRHASAALSVARDAADPNLEASALAQLGHAQIREGEVDAGMTSLDEAMTVATAGEVTDPVAFGDVCCVVTFACEEAGEVERLARWNQVIESYLARHQHAPLLSFCGTCCAEMLQANGELAEAEKWLVQSLQALEGTGHRSRCVHPAAKLAELRVLQGRTEEAERLLSGFEDLPETIRAAVAIHRAKGEMAIAAALLLRRLNLVGEGLLAVPLLSTLVEVQLDQGEKGAARQSAARLSAIAAQARQPRLEAVAGLARGRVALAETTAEAHTELEVAVESFVRLGMPLEAARARLDLARSLRDNEPEVAAREARVALETLERLGAANEADRAASLVRELGGPARTGAKDVGLLTSREHEVLLLLGEGLTNAEIAARLFISTKTAGHHVSSVLAKLHLRSRSEAAAYAVRYAAEERPSE